MTITHWALARKDDYVRVPADITDHDRFATHIFAEADGSFVSLAKVLSNAHTRLWQLVSSGDGPRDGDELVLQVITNDSNKTLTLYYTLFFEEVHDFILRNVRCQGGNMIAMHAGVATILTDEEAERESSDDPQPPATP